MNSESRPRNTTVAYNFQTLTPTLSDTIHFVMDRQTDRQTTVSCK